MIRFKNLNNISEKLENEIPKLKQGEEVVFQMLNGHPNNDNDRNEREKNPILYGKTQLDTKIQIKDPYTNKIVEVGVPERIENDNVVTFRSFLPGKDEGVFSGKFSLIGGRIKDEELFEILWLSPQREGSPCKDESIQPVFKIVNPKQESQKALGKVDTLRKALLVLKDMDEAQLEEFAASKNISGDPDYIKMKVSELAKSDPDKFLAANDDPDKSIKANIKKALDKNVITLDLASRKVSVGASELFTMKKDDLGDYQSAIARWINSAANGKKVYEGILKELKDK